MLPSSPFVRMRKSDSDCGKVRLSLNAKVLLLLLLCGCALLVIYAATSSAKSSAKAEAAITVQAAGRGKPYLNFQDGQRIVIDYRGDGNLTQALRSGQAQARSVASADLDGNATPDLVVGYAYRGMGIITIQRGNPDAFAPKDDSVFVRMQQGYNPDSLLPTAETYQVPEPVDFVLAGDFNHDNRKDVLVGTRGGDLFLLAGDGQGGLSMAEQISLPGTVTAMAAGQFRVFDGQPDVAVGVNGPNGPKLLVYDGADGGVISTPMEFSLASEATAIQFGAMDKDPFMDIAVAAGSEVDIVHGWGRRFSPAPQSQIERISAPSEVRGMALGHFIWDREGRNEIATLAGDGTVSVIQPDGLDTRPFSDSEIFARSRNNQQARTFTEDLEALPGWKASDSESWTSSRTVATSAVAGDASPQSLLTSTNISFRETDDLIVAGSRSELNIIRQTDRQTDPKNAAQAAALSTTGDMAEVSLSSVDAPIAVLPLPQKLNGERSIVVLQSQNAQPTIVPILPAATITVDRGDDSAAAGAALCGVAANDCSLRGAITFANANAGTVITLPDPTTLANSPAAAYILSINGAGGCDGNTIGDLDINVNTTINGAGAATTIIRQAGTGGSGGDRVICMNVPGSLNIVISLSGLTITGGRDLTNIGGGGIVGGAKGNSLTLTSVTISNDQCTGAANHNGGGFSWTGGSVTLTSCLIGGTSAPGADRTNGNLANSDALSGGGLGWAPGSPFAGQAGATGILTITGTTFNHNTSASASAGGGGLDIFSFNTGTGSCTISGSTFTNNQATAQSGGGLIIESTIGTTIDTTSFTSNTASNKGGGIFHGGAGITLNLDGTNPSISFSSNTAPGGGTSISTKGLTSLSGTNITIGGSIEVTTGGTWNSNSGTYNLTDVNVLSGAFNANASTMTISGNLQVVPETPGSTAGASFDGGSGTVNLQGNLTVNGGGTTTTVFNGNTGNFNFTGSNAQSINVSAAVPVPTFNFHNLTVNKASNTLTANGSAGVVGGDLTVTSGTFDLLGNTFNRSAAGGTLTVSNNATLKIGGTQTLPSNYSTHSIGATSNIEYEGTNQTVATLNSSQKYGNLIISGSGTKTLQGAISVATALTINGGTLDASASNFNIDDAGNWTNNVAAANFTPRAATVTFSSGAQNINGGATSQTFNNITMNDTSLTVGGSTTTLNINGNLLISAGTFSAGTASAINVGGNWTNSVGTAGFTAGAGTVTFNNTTAANTQTLTGDTTFNNLTLANTNGTIAFGSTTTTVANTLSRTSGTTMDPGTGTFVFTGGAGSISGASDKTFNNLTINGGASISNSSGGNLTIQNDYTNNGTFSQAAGLMTTFATGADGNHALSGSGTTTFGSLIINGSNTVDAGSHNFNVAGANFTVTGTFTGNTGTVTFTGNAIVQTLGGAGAKNFNNLTINNSGGGSVITSGSSPTVAGLLRIQAGSFTTSSTLNNVQIDSGATLIGTAATTMNVSGNWTNNGTFTPGGNTVNFNGVGNTQTISGSTFANLTLSHTGGGTVQGTNGTTMSVSGNWTSNGAFAPNGNTVNFNGAGVAQTISGSATTQTFDNFTVNKSGAPTLSVAASTNTLDINGNVTLTLGTFAAGTATAITVAGNWTNNGGAFTPGSGTETVTFDGAAGQTIGGTASTTFNNLQISNTSGGVNLGNSETVGGTLTLTSGALSIGANTLTLNGAISSGGGTLTGGNTSNITFGGAGASTTLPTVTNGLGNLTINRANGIALGADLTVNGVLTLTSGDLDTGANTLTMPSTASSTGTTDVIGNVLRTGFTTGGAALSFGNPFNTIQVTAGTAPANILVNLVKSVPTGIMSYPNAVARTYTITPSASGFTGTLRLHYQNTVPELNGNDPATMNLWRFDSGINQWRPNPATARDCAAGCTTNLSNFWAERTGVTTFSPWTLNSTNSPTAAPATISGRITTPDGSPLGGAVMHLSGAASRTTISDGAGNYRFENVDTDNFYTVTPSLANYQFTPASRSFSLVGNITDAAFTANADASQSANAIDMTEYFVRQQYLDFLGREPDQGGLEYWSARINQCGGDAACISQRRIDVSAAFFASAEFQQTGSYIYGVYAGTLGRTLNYDEFNADRSQVLGGSGLDPAKTAFAQAFVQRPEFINRYPQGMTREQFVDAVIQTMTQRSGVDHSSLRDGFLSDYDTGGRALVVRHASEASSFVAPEYNKAFVLMEYFGYLRRDVDPGGYAYWLDVLNNSAADNYRGMVCAFVTSSEYQLRFSTVITRNNGQCGP